MWSFSRISWKVTLSSNISGSYPCNMQSPLDTNLLGWDHPDPHLQWHQSTLTIWQRSQHQIPHKIVIHTKGPSLWLYPCFLCSVRWCMESNSPTAASQQPSHPPIDEVAEISQIIGQFELLKANGLLQGVEKLSFMTKICRTPMTVSTSSFRVRATLSLFVVIFVILVWSPDDKDRTVNAQSKQVAGGKNPDGAAAAACVPRQCNTTAYRTLSW